MQVGSSLSAREGEGAKRLSPPRPTARAAWRCDWILPKVQAVTQLPLVSSSEKWAAGYLPAFSGASGAEARQFCTGLGLQLVLALGGRVEVLEHRLQELKGGPLLPAGCAQHLLMPRPAQAGTESGRRHAVAALQGCG